MPPPWSATSIHTCCAPLPVRTTTGAALTLGKRLSSDLYLSYEQSLAGAMSTVSILYDLSRRLTLRARAGTENAIDLIFTHRYD